MKETNKQKNTRPGRQPDKSLKDEREMAYCDDDDDGQYHKTLYSKFHHDDASIRNRSQLAGRYAKQS